MIRPTPRHRFSGAWAAVATFVCLAGVGGWVLVQLAQRQPVRVNVRWTEATSDADRQVLEGRWRLTAGTRREGTTWQYLLADHSSANIKQIVTDSRVEDTYNLDRRTFDPIDVPWSFGRIALEAAAIGLAGAGLLIAYRRGDVARAVTGARTGARVIAAGRLPVWSAVPVSNRWIVAIALVWGALALPYVAVGPRDIEEYFTGVVTTKIAITNLMHGAWPFWSLDLGLGVPQPLRNHFISHPLAPLCAVSDCAAVLRTITSLHLLAGALSIGLLTLRFTDSGPLAAAAGITYSLSSSFAQTMLADDWPITAINDSALPVMLCAALAIAGARDRRDALWWSLLLGATAGLTLSMSFPVVTIALVAIVSLTAPGALRRLPWFILAAVVTLMIGGAQLLNVFEQVKLTPALMPRRDHFEQGFAVIGWSAFLRPIPFWGQADHWRTVFFGPPFAVAALLSAILIRRPEIRPLRVGLVLGLLGLIVPPAWLLNINTAQWTHRLELNAFGILLAAYGIHYWTRLEKRSAWMRRLIALQLVWVSVAVASTWYPLFARAVRWSDRDRLAIPSSAVAEEIAKLEARAWGRVAFGPNAEVAARRLPSGSFPLAPNQLQMSGVPALSATVFGIAGDELYAVDRMLESEFRLNPEAIQNRSGLDALGVRYFLAFRDDVAPPGAREIRRFTPEARLYENRHAWPEAFFVAAPPMGKLPRVPGCSYGRFLCADFSRADVHRTGEPLTITRLGDGVRLTFAPASAVRYILLTQWYRDGWSVTDGDASVTTAAEQLVGITVGPHEDTVVVRFRPRIRAALFATGIAAESVVTVLLLVLVRRRRVA